jgi:hypothetical protein
MIRMLPSIREYQFFNHLKHKEKGIYALETREIEGKTYRLILGKTMHLVAIKQDKKWKNYRSYASAKNASNPLRTVR